MLANETALLKIILLLSLEFVHEIPMIFSARKYTELDPKKTYLAQVPRGNVGKHSTHAL